MQDDEPAHPHRWLKWMGLQEHPEDPDAWVAVTTDLPIDDDSNGSSELASRIVARLSEAGIEAQQKSYVRPDTMRTVGTSYGILFDAGPAAPDRIRFAVIVRHRDLERAGQLVAEVSRESAPRPISDAELTRQSLEAGEGRKRKP